MTLRPICLGVLASSVLMSLAGGAAAQVVMPIPQGLSQQQFQGMMMMRAMQMGGNQVRTGYPQALPYGNQGFGGNPSAFQTPDDEPADSGRSTSQQRIEARKQREEQQRLARENAKAKRLEAAKGKKADNGKKKANVASTKKSTDAKTKKTTSTKRVKNVDADDDAGDERADAHATK